MAGKALSPKHKRFVAEYLKDLNATQACIRAGYTATNADVTGPRLLGNVGIAAAIAAGQAKLAEKAELTAEQVLANLEAARVKAMGESQCAAAIRACELQGKHIGMFVERREVTERRFVVEAPAIASDSETWERQYGRPN